MEIDTSLTSIESLKYRKNDLAQPVALKTPEHNAFFDLHTQVKKSSVQVRRIGEQTELSNIKNNDSKELQGKSQNKQSDEAVRRFRKAALYGIGIRSVLPEIIPGTHTTSPSNNGTKKSAYHSAVPPGAHSDMFRYDSIGKDMERLTMNTSAMNNGIASISQPAWYFGDNNKCYAPDGASKSGLLRYGFRGKRNMERRVMYPSCPPARTVTENTPQFLRPDDVSEYDIAHNMPSLELKRSQVKSAAMMIRKLANSQRSSSRPKTDSGVKYNSTIGNESRPMTQNSVDEEWYDASSVEKLQTGFHSPRLNRANSVESIEFNSQESSFFTKQAIDAMTSNTHSFTTNVEQPNSSIEKSTLRAQSAKTQPSQQQQYFQMNWEQALIMSGARLYQSPSHLNALRKKKVQRHKLVIAQQQLKSKYKENKPDVDASISLSMTESISRGLADQADTLHSASSVSIIRQGDVNIDHDTLQSRMKSRLSQGFVPYEMKWKQIELHVNSLRVHLDNGESLVHSISTISEILKEEAINANQDTPHNRIIIAASRPGTRTGSRAASRPGTHQTNRPVSRAASSSSSMKVSATAVCYWAMDRMTFIRTLAKISSLEGFQHKSFSLIYSIFDVKRTNIVEYIEYLSALLTLVDPDIPLIDRLTLIFEYYVEYGNPYRSLLDIAFKTCCCAVSDPDTLVKIEHQFKRQFRHACYSQAITKSSSETVLEHQPNDAPQSKTSNTSKVDDRQKREKVITIDGSLDMPNIPSSIPQTTFSVVNSYLNSSTFIEVLLKCPELLALIESDVVARHTQYYGVNYNSKKNQDSKSNRRDKRGSVFNNDGETFKIGNRTLTPRVMNMNKEMKYKFGRAVAEMRLFRGPKNEAHNEFRATEDVKDVEEVLGFDWDILPALSIGSSEEKKEADDDDTIENEDEDEKELKDFTMPPIHSASASRLVPKNSIILRMDSNDSSTFTFNMSFSHKALEPVILPTHHDN